MKVTVVGSGVLGLTCAVRLQEAGHRVRVVAREPWAETTSAVAAAVWFPFLAAPVERVTAWATATYRALVELAAREPESGVVLRELLAVAVTGAPLEVPPWRDAVRGFRAARRAELPPGAREGWVAELPVVETPRHLPWLERRLRAAGGTLEIVPGGVAALDEAAPGADAIVCCAGLGARELAGDATLQAVRGQVVRVRAPGIARVLLADDAPGGPVYVIPRRDDCVVGGTAEPLAVAEEGDAAARLPVAATSAAILARAAALLPELAAAPVLGARVGLRPVRPAVRLEREARGAGPPVVHCYGHGGSGYTLAWGCADEVLALLSAA